MGHCIQFFYVSRKLLPRETRYTVTEREALAVVWALTKLYRYLYGRHFEIMSDHEALSLLNSSKLSVSPRVIRWQLFLQTFDCGRDEEWTGRLLVAPGALDYELINATMFC